MTGDGVASEVCHGCRTALTQGLTVEVDGKDEFDVRHFTVEEGLSTPSAVDLVGPAGETIHTDEFGRVRVRFHRASIDSIHLPRIGQEVIVGFLGGNPEEQLIVGRMHTNLNRPPLALPQNKDPERIDPSSSIGNDRTDAITRNDSESVGGNQQHQSPATWFRAGG